LQGLATRLREDSAVMSAQLR